MFVSPAVSVEYLISLCLILYVFEWSASIFCEFMLDDTFFSLTNILKFYLVVSYYLFFYFKLILLLLEMVELFKLDRFLGYPIDGFTLSSLLTKQIFRFVIWSFSWLKLLANERALWLRIESIRLFLFLSTANWDLRLFFNVYNFLRCALWILWKL